MVLVIYRQFENITCDKRYREIPSIVIEEYAKSTLREKCPNTAKYGPEKTPYLETFYALCEL